jgi:hypothetical protein
MVRDLGTISRNRTKYFKPSGEPKKPTIFVIRSGMMIQNMPCSNTAACLLGSAKNRICFRGYCDPNLEKIIAPFSLALHFQEKRQILAGKDPDQLADDIINNCAPSNYRDLLSQYPSIARRDTNHLPYQIVSKCMKLLLSKKTCVKRFRFIG